MFGEYSKRTQEKHEEKRAERNFKLCARGGGGYIVVGRTGPITVSNGDNRHGTCS